MHTAPFLTLSADDVYATLLSLLSDMMATISPQIPSSADTSHNLHLQAEYLNHKENREAFLYKASTFFCLEDTQTLKDSLASNTDLYALAHAIAGALVTQDEVRLCFHSSGSTGSPQRHIYPLSVFQAEVMAVLEHLPPFSRVISVMPVHHIFGFIFTLLLPKQARVPHKQFSPLALSSLVKALQLGDIVIGFPFFWKNLGNLLHQGKCNPPACSATLHGVSSTSPCPQEIPQLLLGLSDGAPQYIASFTEIYGSTETSAVGIRRYPSAHYQLLNNWNIKESLSPSQTIVRCQPPAPAQQATPMPDLVEWIDSHRFIPLRRHDNAVQVAGQNVYPQRIAQTLMEHPCIQQCAIRLMRPDEGMRLKAFIVPTDSRPETLLQLQPSALRQWCTTRLDAPSTPRIFTLGSALPQTPMGKLTDW